MTVTLKEVGLDLVVPAKDVDFNDLCVLLLEKPDLTLVKVTLLNLSITEKPGVILRTIILYRNLI